MAVLRKRVTKRGVIYDVDFIFLGRRYIRSTKTGDVKVAKQVLGEIQGRIARGTFNLLENKKKDISLAKFQQEYFAYAKSYKEDSTITLEKTYVRQFVDFIGGGKNLRSLDVTVMDRWRADFLGKKRSPATFNIVLRMLHAMFEIAVKWQYLDENPFKQIQKMKVAERRLFLLDEEMRILFGFIERDANLPNLRENVRRFRKHFKLYVEFLLNTGLRRNEAINLRSENIDWSRNVLYIEMTKTKQMRAVPMNRRVQEILREVDGEMFRKLHPHDVTRKFREYLKEAGLSGFKLHSLRHTFSCRLLALGVDLYTISRLLGHTDIKTSMIYAKANVTMLRSAVDKLDENSRKNLLEGVAV